MYSEEKGDGFVSMEQLRYELANEQDKEEIYELAGINREEATGFKSENGREKMIEEYEHSFKMNPNAAFLCGKIENELIGWVMIDNSKDWLTGDLIGWINDVFVKQNYRGKGHARNIMMEALQYLEEIGFPDVRLNVYVHNEPAIRLYESLGFKDLCKFMKRSL
jgi:ribosomal protein S18 acetylase RimI-like enzyme